MPPSQTAGAGDTATKWVMLVDDDLSVREALSDALMSEGYIVSVVGNGTEALELAGRAPLDLVLLDLNMPAKNGWETFEQLTARHPLLPIIIITARLNQLLLAVNAGAGALLEKPMDMQVLLSTMKRLLDESAETRLSGLAGKESEFHYKPSQSNQVEPASVAILRLFDEESERHP